MTTGDQWTELLACSRCGLSGRARLSQPENQPFDFSVEAIPPGFKVVRLEFGKVFYCEVCNQPVNTRQSCPRCDAQARSSDAGFSHRQDCAHVRMKMR